MNYRRNGQSGDYPSSLIGERTPEKISGLSYTVSALLFFALSLAYVLLFGGNADGQAALYGAFLVAPVVFFLTACWYFSFTKTSVKDFFKEQKCAPKYYAIALLLQAGLLSLGELNVLFLKCLQRFGYEESEITLPSMQGMGFVGVLLTVAVLPALFEELFFRGIFLREMRGFSVVGKALLCGALFALYHQNPAQTVYQFVCGVAFALVAAKAGSFLPTVLSHFLNNALIVVLQKCGVESYPLPVYIGMLVVSGVCLAVGVWLFAKDKREKPQYKGKYTQFVLGAAAGILVFAVTWCVALVEGF